MKSVNTSAVTYLVGGAPYDQRDLKLLYEKPNTLIAVDGGANCLPTSLVPDLIIGDLDSHYLEISEDSQKLLK